MPTLVTTAETVVDLFNVTPAARALHRRWTHDKDRSPVVEHVMAHQTKALYSADPGIVERVCRTTEHALGNVDKKIALQVDPIEDWFPAYAFAHVLHYSVERAGRLLTWQEFFRFIQDDLKASEMLWAPSLEQIQRVVALDRWSDYQVKAAVRWRVGNAYYSFLREVFVVSYWRALGLDVQMHPLADALFRVDAWYDRTVIVLYVGNQRYRNGSSGRKKLPQELLGGVEPAFRFVPIRLKPATRFGVVHLPPVDQVWAAATLIDPEFRHERRSRSA